MSGQPSSTSGKVCIVCGVDVSRKPRVKDQQGRYMCEGLCERTARERAKAAATQQASARQAAPPMPKDEGYDMMADLLSESPAASESACPGCGNAMPGGALVCMNCGYNARVGKAAKTKVIRTPVASQMPVPRKRASGEFGPSCGAMFFIVAGGISAVALLGFVSPLFAVLALFVACVVHLVGHIWGIVAAFREGDTGWGICGILSFFVPLIGLAYLYYVLVPNTDKWSKALYGGGLVALAVSFGVLFAAMGPEQFNQLGAP